MIGCSISILQNLVPCASVVERNLLADTAKVVEKNKTGKRKDDFRQVVAGGLIACGYDAAVCKSRWDKSPNFPAGTHPKTSIFPVFDG